MAQDLPDIPELVRTSREFVERITAKLDGEDRYHALCTSYLLDIVQRELTDWAPQITEDDERLRKLLGDETVPLASLTEALSEAIRAGKFDDKMPALLDALISHVESKVSTTKPSYLAETPSSTD